MTLDEAIKHAEEVAIEEDKLCKRYDDASGYTRSHNEEIRTSDAKKCEKCAAEHRQLAKWLKDYKRLKEQEPKMEQFAKWVATEIFDDDWEYNKEAFAELACRKLAKLGFVKEVDGEWLLAESEDEE